MIVDGIAVDAHSDACHASFVDEAMTEHEENCILVTKNDTHTLVATKPIEPGDQLLTRYGHDYWCQSKFPLLLLMQMYEKYKLLHLTTDQHAKWRSIIKQKTLDEQRHHRQISPPFIYCAPP